MAPLGDTLNAARGSRDTSTSAGEQHAHRPAAREDNAFPRLGVNNPNGQVLPTNHQNEQIEHRQRHSSRRKDKCHLRTKTSIKIAGLNIRGHGSTNIEHAANKWGDIRLMMLDRRIGILVIGEAHMNADRRDDIDRKYGKDIKLYYTKLPDTPNAAGVAIILNKNITNVEGVQTHEIVPGHAMLLEYYWHNTERLSVLAIYAPNTDTPSNTNFWVKVREFFAHHPRIRKPDFMIGDCNMVEEPLDRLPARSDNTLTVDALDELKNAIQVEDGWRNTYPTTLQYTYRQKRTGQITKHSRLDRIYINPNKMPYSYEWKIESPGVATDHDMISVRYTCETAPIIGQGRWILPKYLMYDITIKKFLDEDGKQLESEMDRVDGNMDWNPTDNHQTLWSNFKKRFTKLARERAKIVIPRLVKQIADLEAKIDTISNDIQITEEERSLSTAALKDALATLEERRYKTVRTTARTKFTMQSETISRYWSILNKDRTKRDLIQRLEIQTQHDEPVNHSPDMQGEPTYETNSLRMADMMKEYHESLQKDLQPPNENVRGQATYEILNNIETKVPNQHKNELEKKLTLADVNEALKLSANYKAPGLDGICYEIWKLLQARFENAKTHQKQALNIIHTLQRVYNDIENHGLAPGTEFSESWMCPLYKKNDRSQMANYRPISLLNTDYKIMTKALTIKL
ncbi:hypothetical protein EV368DRAFT_30518, partial [Lentinula lateritia]